MTKIWTIPPIPPENYKGLQVHCAPNAHSVAASLITANVPIEGSVLDLAAGTGAWLSRLYDIGFNNLSAVELDSERFNFNKVIPVSLDLNSDFSQKLNSSFQLVTALEIIEHIDNPRHFLKNIHQLICSDGYLLVTTPNIGHWAGRLIFLASGEHRYFKESDYHNQGHISPITHLHMNLMFREIGFELIAYRTAGSFYSLLKKIITLPLYLAFKILYGSQIDGDVSIYLVKKTKPVF